MPDNERVREYYNDHVSDEDKRLDRHPFEVPVTLHFVDKYLRPGQKIFDVACGTGRIASLLMDRGFYVGLNDLSDKNIELSHNRLDDRNHTLFIGRADALVSPGWDKERWDAVFILGPLYHLLSFDKRLEGPWPGATSSPAGWIRLFILHDENRSTVYGLKHNPQGILYPDGARKLWEERTDDSFVMATEWFTDAYFAQPEEVNPLIREAGREPLHLAGAEGIFGERFELFHNLDPR